jgi:hypothetical protein
MAKLRAWVVAPAVAGMALVAGCENIPYYNDSLNWFSWSEYDPEVKAIEADIPPPGELEAPASGDRAAFVRDGRGDFVYADPSPGAVVTLGATPLMSSGAAGATVSVADAGSADPPGGNSGAPLVGIRSSVWPSVTWRRPRGSAQ